MPTARPVRNEAGRDFDGIVFRVRDGVGKRIGVEGCGGLIVRVRFASGGQENHSGANRKKCKNLAEHGILF